MGAGGEQQVGFLEVDMGDGEGRFSGRDGGGARGVGSRGDIGGEGDLAGRKDVGDELVEHFQFLEDSGFARDILRAIGNLAIAQIGEDVGVLCSFLFI